jgi:tRNA threonylcarbamoyladenosine biosynthesis protein TsaB
MKRILSIDTATRVCSVALHADGNLLASQHLHIDKSHSGLLTVLVDNLLSYCQLQMSELDAIAVSEGPGSYTGLRIGLSTAKGLAYALEKPLILVNTLEAMARGVSNFLHENALACPMIDARRMEVYCLLADAAGTIVVAPQAHIVTESSFAKELAARPVYFFGDGAEKCKPLLGTHSHAVFVSGIVPSAVPVGELAWQKYQQSDFADLAYSEPFYLKEFQSHAKKS